MKSTLFQKTPINKEAITKDITKLLSLSQGVRESLPRIAADLASADIAKEQDEILEEASSRLEIDQAIILDNMGLVKFFLSMLTPDGEYAEDSMEDIADDLVELGVSDEKEKNQLISVLDNIRNIAQTIYFDVQQRSNYEKGCFPSLKSFTSTVEHRAVFDATYKHGKIDKYNPKCVNLIPIANIRLRFTEDSNINAVSFQITPSHLNWLINNLSALQKEIVEAERHIGEMK